MQYTWINIVRKAEWTPHKYYNEKYDIWKPLRCWRVMIDHQQHRNMITVLVYDASIYSIIRSYSVLITIFGGEGGSSKEATWQPSLFPILIIFSKLHLIQKICFETPMCSHHTHEWTPPRIHLVPFPLFTNTGLDLVIVTTLEPISMTLLHCKQHL